MNNTDKSTLFVTGSASFIGRALLERCARDGIAAVGIDSGPNPGIGARQADIRDPALADLIPEGATIVHLAAISRDPDCRADPRLAFDVNVNGTLNVAAAAKVKNARQLIFASSEWVYGEVSNQGVQREDSSIDVTSMKSEYALTKIVGEQLLKLTCTLPAATVLRFGIVYGPRPSNWSAVENLFNASRSQDEIKIGSGKTARCFIHVGDIVSGILTARGRTGFEIFNLSGDQPVPLSEVIGVSAKIWGRSVRIVETNPSAPSVRNPDNALARERLGWRPEMDITAGLRDLKTFFEASGV